MYTKPETELQRYERLLQSLVDKQTGQLLYAGRLLQRASQKYPHIPALIYKEQVITFLELYRRATFFSRYLRSLGLMPRDRVLISFENHPAFYVAYFAVWQAGAVVAPLNTFLKEHELAHIIADAEPRFIITSSDRVDLFKLADGKALPPIITDSHMRLDEPVPADLQEDEPICLETDEMAALLYTSGTTGAPKGVMLSSRNIISNLVQGEARFQLFTYERVIGLLPLFHVFAQNACVWTSTFMGGTVILVPRIERRYILDALQHKPTMFIGVPALYGLLCLMKNAPLDKIKYFISGGDALPDKIRSAFSLVYRRKLCNGYGLTETSPLLCIDLEDKLGPTNTVGTPCAKITLEIRDLDEKPLPPQSIGQIWAKGDNIMLGYYRAPEATEQVLKNGWFNTGDLGYIDAAGKLVITGRMKDLIIHKGVNIYPQEIENVISSHMNVLRVGVVGQRNAMVGEYPIAFVQLRKEQPGIEKILNDLCKQHLALYKVPREFICSVKELPLTSTSKVDKKVLRGLLTHE